MKKIILNISPMVERLGCVIPLIAKGLNLPKVSTVHTKLFGLQKSIHNWFQLRYQQLLLPRLHRNIGNLYCAYSTGS